MYKPVQKKSSSWTPASSQSKSKSLTKPGTFSVQPKSESKSSQQQEIPDYSSSAADALAANVMRSLETPQQSVEEGKDLDEMSEGAGAIQTKLTVGTPGDKYEQEADQVAAQVMSMSVAPDHSPQVQRFGEEDNPVHRWSLAQSITPVVQRQVDEQMQMRELVQRAFQAGGNQASGDLESRLNASKGGGSALAPEVRAFMEPRFGADFSSVRVHTGSEAVQMNRELGAQAFAHGSDVYFGAGKSPGNNELTAHELTHVVQQTGVGEVHKQSANEQGWKSPALQMRSQLRTSSLSRLIIQRAVTTSGGEWDTDQYDLAKDKDGAGNPTPAALGLRGVDIKLKFTPKDPTDAELIGLTQSVQAFVNNAPKLTPAAATRAIPSKDAIGINTGPGETDEGTAIDRAAGYNNPIYPVQSAASTSLADTNTAAGWGQNGWHYKDSSGNPQHQDATLIDTPRRPNAAKDSRHIFETTALATKGKQAGTYYGYVRWGWRTDDKGDFTKIPLTVVSQGVPSSTFMKAAEIWNPGKSSTGADNVDLPIVDVKVTTSPITGVYPSGFVGPPLQIPTGTRIQVIRNATPPSTNGQIRVVDGTFTGNTLEVTPADMANLRDERP